MENFSKEQEIEILLNENPLLRKALETLAEKGEKPLKDPREKEEDKNSYIHKSVFVCSICEEVNEEFVLMRYVKRLSSFIRSRSITKDEIGDRAIKTSIVTSSLTYCPKCKEKLLLKTKEELVDFILFQSNKQKMEIRGRQLKEKYLKENP